MTDHWSPAANGGFHIKHIYSSFPINRYVQVWIRSASYKLKNGKIYTLNKNKTCKFFSFFIRLSRCYQESLHKLNDTTCPRASAADPISHPWLRKKKSQNEQQQQKKNIRSYIMLHCCHDNKCPGSRWLKTEKWVKPQHFIRLLPLSTVRGTSHCSVVFTT